MSVLSDLEICKRIAEIDGLEIDFAGNGLVVIHNGGDGNIYNPLTNDALCFKLMVKYKIDWQNRESFKMGAAVKGDILVADDSPNKAICLAIIEAREGYNEKVN